MEFQWPANLALLLLVPALVAAYVLAQRRRRRDALRYASLSLLREAIGRGPGIRRHVPPAIFLLGFTVLMLALARPAALVSVPSLEGIVILAIDVSGSMQADDIQPTRMEAAKAAANMFVEKQRQNRQTRIGVVSFSDNASIVMAPTIDRDGVIAAINRLRPQRATAIGRAILVSLEAIFEDVNTEPPADPDQVIVAPATRSPRPPPPPPPKGEFAPAAIVLLTDGENNQYPPPLSVVDEAVRRGVRIYTVGVGTPEGTILRNQGRAVRTQLDEDTLKKIAEVTRAQYFNAASETDLLQIYQNLATQLVLRTERSDITVAFAALAGVLLLAAGVLSLLWFNRLP